MSVGNSPVVAVVGSTGYVGKCLMPPFLEACNTKALKELRVLTSKEKLESEQIKSYVASGAKAIPVNFNEIYTVTSALEGVDAVVSAIGTGDGVESVKEALLQAMVQAKVKVYFPSEFGTNHYKVPDEHPVFDGKRMHFYEAKKLGLNPIRMLIGDIMESSFGKWFGLDCVTGVWTTVGDGANLPCAMTAERDIGRFTLEAVLLASKDVSKCPDEIEVYSDMRSLSEYAKVFEKESKREIKIEKIPLEEFRKEYEKSKEFEKLIMIMFAEGAYDYSTSIGNNLLNPGESKWKLKKIEEYAKETGGIPWNDS